MTSFIHHILLPIMALLCATSGLQARSSTIDSLLSVIDNGYGDPAEGVWRMTATPDAVLAICPSTESDGSFDVWLLDSPDFTLEPCTRIGRAIAGSQPGSYDLTLVENPGSPKPGRRSFIANIDESGLNMRLTAYRRGKRISLWRWIPYLFRVTVIDKSNRPSNHDGLRRIYPSDGGIFTL
ncbi:MAG: hypothetical protein K2H03_07065 [Muribaculaceae bacterium]|nr:hypothetical protein [Muribaculaceae bacterium]